ncbi:hypothetical protein Bca52824_026416 [Brassica carinata]|uniref:Uncharacterized protein n=1 Tax=Brassica carinata TaxID=52824 RepID=A0A8X7SGG0_BRACI|nr:hypothetical protein Bca52824_026416 [Brassica carinata]
MWMTKREELVIDYMFHLEHVDIVPSDMTIRRISTKVTVVDKDLNPEYSNSICIEETGPTLVLENIADTPGVLDDKGAACVVEPSVKVILEDATSHLRSTRFPPFTGKPSLRFLTHRLDRNTKLRIQHPSHPVKERPAPPLIHSSLPHPSTESAAAIVPLQAVSQMFSSIRGKALRTKPPRF